MLTQGHLRKQGGASRTQGCMRAVRVERGVHASSVLCTYFPQTLSWSTTPPLQPSRPSSPRGLPAACLTDSSETEGARSSHGFDSNVTVLFLLHMAHPRQGLVWHCAVITLKAPQFHTTTNTGTPLPPPSTLTARVHAPHFNSGCMVQ